MMLILETKKGGFILPTGFQCCLSGQIGPGFWPRMSKDAERVLRGKQSETKVLRRITSVIPLRRGKLHQFDVSLRIPLAA